MRGCRGQMMQTGVTGFLSGCKNACLMADQNRRTLHGQRRRLVCAGRPARVFAF